MNGLRNEKFLHGVRKAAKWEREAGLWLKPGHRTQRTWPLCLTCGREVEAAELKNVTQTSVELWAKCHGKEDWTTIQFPFRIVGDPLDNEEANVAIKQGLKAWTAFDPYRILK